MKAFLLCTEFCKIFVECILHCTLLVGKRIGEADRVRPETHMFKLGGRDTVKRIVDDRMPVSGKMNTDLMGAAGKQTAAHQ